MKVVEGVRMAARRPQIETTVDTVGNFVLHRVIGPIRSQDIIDALVCIARSRSSLEETRILWDMREAVFDWNGSAVIRLGDAAQAVAGSRGTPAKFAVVLEKQRDFDTARQLELVTRGAIPLRVFIDYEEALDWLGVEEPGPSIGE